MEGFLPAAQWAERNGLSHSKTIYLCKQGKLLSVVIREKRWISANSKLEAEVKSGWLTIPEFAAQNGMSLAWARRLVKIGKVETAKQSGRIYVSIKTPLVKRERQLRSGAKFVSFEMEDRHA